ncbi:CtsR family transcriptional regulator [Natribacillus halophilus]|nr:CtsR family transcriptional regulator [Natribacillus halophilus]
MGNNISDIIEDYLKSILTNEDQNLIEIKRSELAKHFECVPSQINYVIRTRFTVEKGYIVESKRGGGGYIRITKVRHTDHQELCDQLIGHIGQSIDQATGKSVVLRLLEEGAVSKREGNMILAAIDREVIALPMPSDRDVIRANVLKAMLASLKYKI